MTFEEENIDVNLKYKFIASEVSVFNVTIGVSFSNQKYSTIKSKRINGIGTVYLAPRERTIILPDKIQKSIKKIGLSYEDIITRCNNSLDMESVISKKTRKF